MTAPARDETGPTCTIDLRVRYAECDPMGVAHHAAYPVWFEMGRTELLRASGLSYRDLEARSVYIAVVKLNVTYRRPARYDDCLTLRTTLTRWSRVRLEHEYDLRRDGLLLAVAQTVLACLDAEGRPRELPEQVLPAGTSAP